MHKSCNHNNILIFGGTFDPVHYGHLNTAIKVQNDFNFERFIFLPCKIPLLKNHSLATPSQRLDMLNLALSEYPNYHPFDIDDREIKRHSPSYMVTTLNSYRLELGKDVSITLLMGNDTFRQLPHWYQWKKILALANILVINRPKTIQVSDNETSTEIVNILRNHETKQKVAICKNTNGLIYCFNAGLYDISSTFIRYNISSIIEQEINNNDARLILPKSVMHYIKQNSLYTLRD